MSRLLRSRPPPVGPLGRKILCPQCGGETYEAIANDAKVDIESVKATVHFVLAFIRLPRRTE